MRCHTDQKWGWPESFVSIVWKDIAKFGLMPWILRWQCYSHFSKLNRATKIPRSSVKSLGVYLPIQISVFPLGFGNAGAWGETVFNMGVPERVAAASRLVWLYLAFYQLDQVSLWGLHKWSSRDLIQEEATNAVYGRDMSYEYKLILKCKILSK